MDSEKLKIAEEPSIANTKNKIEEVLNE